MTLLPKNSNGCPTLILAPMEGVGDAAFRQAMAGIGGFNLAIREFIRVPANAHIKSLVKVYYPEETAPIPLTAQIMGQDADLMAEMAFELQMKGALRIDLNCGCPSNTVTGKGAGSSLLKTPSLMHQIAKAMVSAVSIPVSLKMRSGYEDTSLFRENLMAAEESGVKFITLHPRTKVEGYGPPADWDLIAEAKSVLKIPLVGNGDILNVDDALKMLKHTNCDALMIGRGSIINPFIFHEIQAHFSGTIYKPTWDALDHYLNVFVAGLPPLMPERNKAGKMKQLMSFLFKGNSELLAKRQEMLTAPHGTLAEFLDFAMPIFKTLASSSYMP
jgi:tRNA-dihydrouridine synthase C